MANKFLQRRLQEVGTANENDFVSNDKIREDIRIQEVGVAALPQEETDQQRLAKQRDEEYAARGVLNRPGA